MSDAAPLPSPQRRPPPIFWISIILLVLLLAVGISALVAYARLSHPPEVAQWQDPWQMPEPERISAGLAVWSLTGAPAELVYRQALATDHLDTAAAQTLLSLKLPDNQRLGWLSVLAHRFAGAQRLPDARIFTRHSANAAMLMPDLPDSVRVRALMQAAENWADLDDREQALQTLEQALVIAQFSAELSPPQRKQTLTQIGQQVLALGETARGQAISAIPVLDYAPASPSAFSFTPLLTQSPNFPETLNQLVLARQQTAQRYIEDWEKRGGVASAGATRELAASLIDEDLARKTFYRDQLSQEDLSPEARVILLLDQSNWLLLRYAIANQLYGASIVPNWEAERPAIRNTLNDSLNALNDALGQYETTLPAAEQPAASMARARLLTTWAVLGLLPDADMQALSQQLEQAAASAPPEHIYLRLTLQKDHPHIELFYLPAAPQDY